MERNFLFYSIDLKIFTFYLSNPSRFHEELKLHDLVLKIIGYVSPLRDKYDIKTTTP